MIEGRKCNSCGYTYVSMVDYCSRCGSRELDVVKFKGEGRIYSFTTVRVPITSLKSEAPFVIGIVDLAEGPRITVRLNMPETEIAIGKTVVCAEQKPTYKVFG